jgi:hypothetical protein
MQPGFFDGLPYEAPGAYNSSDPLQGNIPEGADHLRTPENVKEPDRRVIQKWK